MRGILRIVAALGAIATPLPALADAATGFEDRGGGSTAELPPYLQCVPYARQVSGIQIYGDALTWWDQADGRYQRGHTPRVGAVMAFAPYRNMTLGHVAAVSKVIDSRTVLLRHANWSPIDGRRGQIENDVMAVDVSPGNDWSQVRVWYDPIQGLGTTAWPVEGFIYGDPAKRPPMRVAAATPAPQPAVYTPPVSDKPSRAFMNAFADMSAAPARTPAPRRLAAAPKRVSARVEMSAPQRQALPQKKALPARVDPIEAAVARYGS